MMRLQKDDDNIFKLEKSDLLEDFRLSTHIVKEYQKVQS